MLKSLFKPKWQHPKFEIRQQTLAGLDTESEIEIIAQMATSDPSEQLREQALNKLTDQQSLQQLLNSANTPDQWCKIASRLNQVSPQIEGLTDDFTNQCSKWNHSETIKSIAKCKDVVLANALLMASNDPGALFEIASNAKSIDFRLTAVEKINDLELLQKLLKNATNKQVIRAIKVKLSASKENQQKIDHTLEQADRLLTNIYKLSRQSWFDPQYEIKLNSLISHWQELDQQLLLNTPSTLKHETSEHIPTQNFSIDFQICLKDCQKIIAGYKQELEQAALEQDALNKQQGLCSELEKLVNEMQSNSMQSINSYLSVKGALKILDDNWQQTISAIAPDAKIKNQYVGLREILYNSFNNWDLLSQLESEFEALIANSPENSYNELDNWLKKWKLLEDKLHWPKALACPEVLNTWRTSAEDYRNQLNKIVVSQKKKASYINQKLTLLEKHCKQKNLIAANKLINYIEKRSQELIDDFHQSFKRRLEHITPQLDELRDWHAFATSPKKESLCLEMENLSGVDSNPLEKARQVRELQLQWRELIASDANADEQLWDRFKLASDTAYLPCLNYYAEQDKVKAENLKQQTIICEQLEKIVSESGWNQALVEVENHDYQDEIKSINWKSIETTLKKSTQNFKKFNAIPDNERKNIQQRFNLASKVIHHKLQDEKQSNLEQRCTLVEEAKQLIDIEDINQAISNAINLQKQWKQIGLTFFKADRQQWTLFRAALDDVFEKRETLKQSFKDELQSNQKKLEEITKNIIQLSKLNDAELKPSFEQFKQLKQSWSNEIELPRSTANKVLTNFEKACLKYQEHYSGLEQRLKKTALESLLNALALLQHAEEKILQSNNNLTESELKELSKELSRVTCSESQKEHLIDRLHNISNSADAKESNSGLLKLRTLALDLEILLGIDSPQEYKQQRMEIQLQQLQQGIGLTSPAPDKSIETLRMFNQWIKIGFINPAERIELDKRRKKIFAAAGL